MAAKSLSLRFYVRRIAKTTPAIPSASNNEHLQVRPFGITKHSAVALQSWVSAGVCTSQKREGARQPGCNCNARNE